MQSAETLGPLLLTWPILLHSIHNHKEAKYHGEGGGIVADTPKGKNVLVIDGVITAGTSMRRGREMTETVEKDGGKVEE